PLPDEARIAAMRRSASLDAIIAAHAPIEIDEHGLRAVDQSLVDHPFGECVPVDRAVEAAAGPRCAGQVRKHVLLEHLRRYAQDVDVAETGQGAAPGHRLAGLPAFVGFLE